MATAGEEKKAIITMQGHDKSTEIESPIFGKIKIVIIINNQITDNQNTTQIASGAGRSSAAGSNAAIASSNTLQQQSVGAAGEAINRGMGGEQSEPHEKHACLNDDDEIVIVINNQINKSEGNESAATQIASGGGTFSASGTNSAIEGSNTKQQHSVGGGTDASAVNRGMNGNQQEA